ncbi:MAG: hypothetical protein JNL60_01315 [Bacteroidia bacterium]|nr:hypothetical protein [Bacteroidia bacterium]
MKTLITILLLSFASSMAFAQSASATGKNFSLVYSQDDDALVAKNNEQGQDIIIESLPYFEKLSIPVYIAENLNGTYTFKKHPSLLLPEYFSVVILDNQTGYSFDLKSNDTYSFVAAAQDNPERFVLKIDKVKNTLTAMR